MALRPASPFCRVRALLVSSALMAAACSEPARSPENTPRRAVPVQGGGNAAYVTETPKAPASPAAQPAPAPGPAAAAAVPEAERLFNRSGCVGCHGPRSPFYNHLVTARAKPPAEVARWIRNARELKPDTMMPNYEGSLSEADALVLARWIIAGNPKPAQ
jgi:mono/diheme cytochrome c family protein